MNMQTTQASPLFSNVKRLVSVFTAVALAFSLFVASAGSANAAMSNGAITSFDVMQSSFNPDTQKATVAYSVNAAGKVILEVLDGSDVVKTLEFRKEIAAGNYKTTWDGTDSNGQKVAEGTYKVQLYFVSTTFGVFADDTVVVDYDNGSTTGTAPVITSDYASPTPFDPNNESTYIYFTTNTLSDVSIYIYDGSTLVDTLASDVSMISGSHSKVWDGKNSSNQIVDEGTYTYKVVAENSYGTDTETGNVVVDYDEVDNTVVPNITNAYASPVTFNPSDGETTKVYYTVNTCVNVTVKVYKESNDALVRTLLNNDYICSGSTSITWNGRDSSNNIVSDGDYYIKVTVTNSKGSDTTEENVTVDTDSGSTGTEPNLTNVTVSPYSFDPEDDEDTTLRYTLDKCADVTVEVYDEDDDLVDTLKDEVYQCSGTYSVVWDGEDDSNDVVADGIYEFKITAENNYGDDTATKSVEVDSNGGSTGTEPNLTNVTVSPYTFDPEDDEDTTLRYTLDKCADVTVEVYDEDDDLVDTLKDEVYQCSGTYSVVWNGEDDSNDVVADGIYEFKITAENNYGDDTATKSVEVDSGSSSGSNDDAPSITSVSVDPDTFDPEDESTELEFRLNTCADVTIRVVDEDNKTVRRILTLDELCSGLHTYKWNGKDTDGDYSDDGNYKFIIVADNDEGTDTATKSVEVDKSNNGNNDDENCAGYEDVSVNNAYCDAIEYVTDEDIFDGYSDDTFKPYQAINRAETTKVILKAFDYTILPSDGTNLGFWDLAPEAWYMPYIRTAKQYGIIQGYPDGSFQPARTVNRVELLKLFLETADVSVPACSYQPYSDTPVNQWYSKYVCYAKAHDLMDADSSNNFNPAQPMTRGDVAELFYRFNEEGLFDDAGSTSTSGRPDITKVTLSDYTINQGDNVTLSYTLNVKSDVTVTVLDDENDVIRTLVNDVSQNSGKHTVIWNSEDKNGDEVDEGTYKVRIKASNSKGSDTYTVNVEVDNDSSSTSDLEVKELDLNRTTWNPSTQGSLEISFRMTKTSNVTVAVYDEDDDLVRKLWDDRSTSAGTYEILWNGKDRYENMIDDGTYTIKVSAENSTDTANDSIEVDVNT